MAACALVVTCAAPGNAAFERMCVDAHSISLGGATVGLASVSWPVSSNPALLSRCEDFSVSVGSVPQYFGIDGLSQFGCSVARPFSFGAVALEAARFGMDLYTETRFTIASACAAGDRIGLGAGLTVYHLRISRYGSAWTAGLSAGVLVSLSRTVDLGVYAGNLNAPSIGRSKERLPQCLTTGIAYAPVSEVIVLASVEHDIGHRPQFRLGLQYGPVPGFEIRGGATDQPSTFTAGFGASLPAVKIDYAFSHHVDLGMTHAISLTIVPGKF